MRPEKLKRFDEILSTHEKYLISVVWKLTGDREMFREVWQNVMLELWKNIEKLNGPGTGSYLRYIALAAARKAWKGRPGGSSELLEDLTDDSISPGEHLINSETITAVRSAVAKLSSCQNRAIVMRYLEGKDYCLIAQELGCSEAAVRSHVSKAITALGRLLTMFSNARSSYEK